MTGVGIEICPSAHGFNGEDSNNPLAASRCEGSLPWLECPSPVERPLPERRATARSHRRLAREDPPAQRRPDLVEASFHLAYVPSDDTIEVAAETYDQNDTVDRTTGHTLTLRGIDALAPSVSGAGLGIDASATEGTSRMGPPRGRAAGEAPKDPFEGSRASSKGTSPRSPRTLLERPGRHRATSENDPGSCRPRAPGALPGRTRSEDPGRARRGLPRGPRGLFSSAPAVARRDPETDPGPSRPRARGVLPGRGSEGPVRRIPGELEGDFPEVP